MKKQFYKNLSTLVALLLTSYLSFAETIVVDGINYNITSPTTVEVGSNSFIIGEVVIPSSVTDGGTTYSVTNIGAYAFQYSYDLTKLTIANSVTSIGEYAFSHSNLTSITIPNSVTIIGNHSFQSCTALSSIRIPNSVTTIGMGAFFMLTSLTSINIPSTVTDFGFYAFYGNTALDSVMVESQVPQTITTDVFVNNSPSTTLYVPKGTVSAYQSATGWGNFTFIVEQCTQSDSTLNITACEKYFFNGVDRTVSDTYTQTLTNAAGCDSVVTLNLTIKEKPLFTTQPEDVEVCLNDSLTFVSKAIGENIIYASYMCENQQELTSYMSNDSLATGTAESTELSGTYIAFTAENSCGIDTSRYALLIVNAVDTSVLISENQLTANLSNATYQWIDCDNEKKAIDGAIDQQFTPSVTGNYALVISDGICSDTSACHFIDLNVTGLEKGNNTFTMSPNPASSHVNLNFSSFVSGNVFMVDIHGNIVLTSPIQSVQMQLNTSEIPSGIYVLKIVSDHLTETKPLVIVK